MPNTGRDRAISACGTSILCLAAAAYLWVETHLTPVGVAGESFWPNWVWGLPATAGAALLSFGVTVFFVSAPQVSWEPWIVALSKLAREHGQNVQDDLDRGLWFDAIHGGPRFTIQILPTDRGYIRLFSKRQARHGVLVLRAGDEPDEAYALWTPVGKGRGWVIYAEVLVAARSLMTNVRLAAALDRFFGARAAKMVVFASDGLQLDMGLVPIHAVDPAIREAIDVGRQLWEATE
jgi:hypothetical protein